MSINNGDVGVSETSKSSNKNDDSVIVIGISGASASGKSLLASTLVKELGSNKVSVISEDSYYKDQKSKSFEEREKTNYDHPDAFEHELFAEHLKKLRSGFSVDVPVYNYATHTRSDKFVSVGPSSIIVLEGILLFAEKILRDLMDIRIFIDTPLDLCLVRRIERDVIERERSLNSVINQYQETVRPMFLEFIEPSKRYAHFIVPIGGRNRVAIDLIKARMRELLNGDCTKDADDWGVK